VQAESINGEDGDAVQAERVGGAGAEDACRRPGTTLSTVATAISGNCRAPPSSAYPMAPSISLTRVSSSSVVPTSQRWYFSRLMLPKPEKSNTVSVPTSTSPERTGPR